MEMARRMSPLQTNQMRDNLMDLFNCPMYCQSTCLMKIPMTKKVQSVAKAVVVAAEGEGVVTISTTTISTIITMAATSTRVATVVAPIQSEHRQTTS